MPDGGQQYVYQTAIRGNVAPLLMISGPAGTGKTYSALRLARGIAGPDGKVCLADTDNKRSLLYADEFSFSHLDLKEPFRPMLFERAVLEAQKQGAAVVIIDNFSHEHSGPGGVLEWHEEELTKLTKGDFSKRDSLNQLAWGRVKPAHKHMRDRLYMANISVILCCAAERKTAMQKVTSGPKAGKTEVIDLGFQPVCGGDIPFAMTVSLMLADPARPGVPYPIKALLPALKPIISMDRPLDEATGARIAAWARGDKPPETASNSQGQPGTTVHTEPANQGGTSTSSTSNEAPKTDTPHNDTRGQTRQQPPTEAEIEQGAKDLAAKFALTKVRADHLALVDNRETQKRMDWLRKNRRELYDRELDPAVRASWKRTDGAPSTEQAGLPMEGPTD